MQTNMVVGRGKSAAERLVETLHGLPPIGRFGLRRKSKAERLMETIQQLPPAARIGLAVAASAAISMSASGSTTMWFFAPPSACTRLPCFVPVS